MLRQLGATPAQSTDMIAFFREQAAVAGQVLSDVARRP
jgi:hypothetical protein